MSKSILAIGAIGLGGCVVLSVLLRQALEAQGQALASPIAKGLEQQFGRRLAGPVRVSTESEQGRSRIAVRMCVLAGLQKERIATEAGLFVWNRTHGTEGAPDQVVVTVFDDGDGLTTTRTVPRPSHMR
ncbi:MAG: hypothetical protein KDC98_17405 [Planctomycetes bacterium]|nr:hypothetical protein [Planctomycetota bacterium]